MYESSSSDWPLRRAHLLLEALCRLGSGVNEARNVLELQRRSKREASQSHHKDSFDMLVSWEMVEWEQLRLWLVAQAALTWDRCQFAN